MLLWGQRAGRGQLVVVGGPVGKMTAGDNQLVTAAEEGVGELQAFVQRHAIPGRFVDADRLQTLFRHS